MEGSPLLRVENLVAVFDTDEGPVRALDGVSFELEAGRTLGLVGESGCGKSVTALCILRLLSPPGRIAGGRILFEGRDLSTLSETAMRAIRGARISMIFQEPTSSLHPAYTVGFQIAETLRAHLGLGAAEAKRRAIELLEEVGIPAARERVDAYPHQLSGGMRQRVMIAIALACRPRLVIADEPTTALDVTIQAQILDRLARLRRERGMSLILISHDLGVVAETADEIAVMYAGRIVERAPTGALFASPRHPYTQGLLRSVPTFGDNLTRRRLPTIPGTVPDLRAIPRGCRFRERCERAIDVCAEDDPVLEPVDQGGAHRAACFRAREGVSSQEAVFG